MQGCHFSRGLIVTQPEAYKYYSNIEKYPERYPQYYQNIAVTETTNDSLTAKMFLNINLSREEDHAVVTAKYTFIPETEVRYEVISGPGQGIINNSIIIRGQDTVADKSYKSAVEVNHIPLDLMCYPPPYFYAPEGEKYKEYVFSPEGDRLGAYQRMITYFIEQDLIPLERKTHWGGFKVGELCSKCKKGTLQMTGEKEKIENKTIDYLQCDYCGSDFKNQRIDL
jgi:hypothetical protein